MTSRFSDFNLGTLWDRPSIGREDARALINEIRAWRAHRCVGVGPVALNVPLPGGGRLIVTEPVTAAGAAKARRYLDALAESVAPDAPPES